MPKTITHGQVRRKNDSQLYAVAVESLHFRKVARTATPHRGASAVLILKDTPKSAQAGGTPPYDPYEMYETIMYEDSNNNNTTYLKVTSVVGPAKYQVEVQ